MAKKIILGIIIVIGIFLRLYQLNSLPGGLFLDEIGMAVDAKTLVQNGTDQYGRAHPFYFEDATDFKLPGYIYVTSFFYRIFGSQIITVHLGAALASIASIFLLFYLARLLFPEKKNLPYFVASIFALSPFAIHFARIGYETTFAMCFTIVFLIALVQILHNRNKLLWFLIGSLSILIAGFTYPSARVVMPLSTTIILTACLLFQFPDVKRKQIILSFGFLIVNMLLFIPTILFPFADTRQLSLVLADRHHKTLLGGILANWLIYITSFVRLWNLEFLFDKGDLFAYRHGTKETGIFLQILSLPYLVGFWVIIKEFAKKNFGLVFLLLFTCVAGLPSSLTWPVPYGTRIVVILIPYSLLIGLGLNQLVDMLHTQKVVVRYAIFSIFSAILAFQLTLFAHIYFTHFRQTSQPEFSNAATEMGLYIKNNLKQNPRQQIYFLQTRSCRAWGMDAYHLWYFADLPNQPMIEWNNRFRDARYAAKQMSPFYAYDHVDIPQATVGNIHLYPGYLPMTQIPKGSLMVYCGIQTTHLEPKYETVKKILYIYEDIQRDPFYVITERK